MAQARRSEAKLIERRILDAEKIAALNSDISEKEERLRRTQRELAIAQRLEEDQRQELTRLHQEVNTLRAKLVAMERAGAKISFEGPVEREEK